VTAIGSPSIVSQLIDAHDRNWVGLGLAAAGNADDHVAVGDDAFRLGLGGREQLRVVEDRKASRGTAWKPIGDSALATLRLSAATTASSQQASTLRTPPMLRASRHSRARV
jgi:hypothetical protein